MNKNVPLSELPRLQELCFVSIETAIKRLCEVGVWPRPPMARVLRMGHDFYGDDLRGLGELDDLTEFLASQDSIKSIYLRDTSDRDVLERYWTTLLVNILAETEGASLSQPVFHKWFKRFVNELYADTAVWRAVDTVSGMMLLGKELRLDQFTAITSVPGDRLGSLVPRHDNCFNPHEFPWSHWEGAFPLGKATIVTTLRICKSEYKVWAWPVIELDESRRASAAAIAAIRLTKPGTPFLQCHVEFQISYLPLAEPLGYTATRDMVRLYQKETTIDRTDYKKIRFVWKELMNTGYGQPRYQPQPKVNAMETARARFFRSYEVRNYSWFENLLDLTIALEALFSPADSQEISHRIALRCSWLLGSAPRTTHDDSPNKIYSCVRTMYELRSRIVHGNVPEGKKIQKWITILTGTEYDGSKDWELRELALESARDIVRRSLRACETLSKLPHNGPHWPFPDDFDQSIALSGQQRQWQRAAGIL